MRIQFRVILSFEISGNDKPSHFEHEKKEFTGIPRFPRFRFP